MSTSLVDKLWQPVSARPRPQRRGLAHYLLWAQGAYYGLTGVWPLVSIETFQWVTGRKTDHLPTGNEADHWLVMTVGVLVTAAALALLTAAWRRTISPEIAVLALATALGLAAIDVIYVIRGVILPIYLVDAALQVVIIVSWTVVLLRYKRTISTIAAGAQ